MVLPTSGLLTHLRMEELSGVATGDVITSWPDASGLGNNANTATDSGITVAESSSVALGRMANFPGQYYQRLILANNVMASKTQAEAFIVVKATGTNHDRPNLWFMGGNDRTYYPYPDGKVYDGAFTSARFAWTPTLPIDQWRIYNVSFAASGTVYTARLNGIPQLSTSGFSFSVPATPMIGGDGGGFPWTGQIAEFLLYDRPLTSTERDDVFSYFQDRHPAFIRTLAGTSPVNVGTSSYIPPGPVTGMAPVNVGSSSYMHEVGDSFNRADNTASLGTTDTGQAWQVLAGSWGIVSNQAYMTAGNQQAYAVVETGMSDCDISVKLSGSLLNGGGITFRALDETHLWFMEIVGNGTYLYRNYGGGPSSLKTFTIPWVVGDVATIALRGPFITIKRNGVIAGSYANTSFTTYTKHGLRDYGGVIRLDDFKVTLPAPEVVTSLSRVDSHTSTASDFNGFSTTSVAYVEVHTRYATPVALEPYTGDDGPIYIPFEFSGIIAPEFPPPVPPTDFAGLPDPVTPPTLTKSTTSSGYLVPGTYRYSYAAWKGSQAQATAPSPIAEITLTTENTVTLTYPTVAGAEGYLVYREDL